MFDTLIRAINIQTFSIPKRGIKNKEAKIPPKLPPNKSEAYNTPPFSFLFTQSFVAIGNSPPTKNPRKKAKAGNAN